MTITTPVRTTPRPATTFSPVARIAAISAGTAAAAIVLADLLDPGYSARSEAISALASQESASAPIMIFGFMAMAATLLSAGAYLFRRLVGKAARTGSVLVILAGLLTVVVGLARQDCSNLQAACLAREEAELVSGAHILHNLVSLPVFLFLIVGAFLLASGLRRNGAPRTLARATLVVAIVSLVFAVWFGSGAYGSDGGLVQRVLVVLAFGWPTFLAVRLSRGQQA